MREFAVVAAASGQVGIAVVDAAVPALIHKRSAAEGDMGYYSMWLTTTP